MPVKKQQLTVEERAKRIIVKRPAKARPASQADMKLSLRQLREAGFASSAEWTLGDDLKIEIKELESVPKHPGIYLFVSDRKVLYVGKADDTLHRRIRRYRLTMKGIERPRPVHKGIESRLRGGDRVYIYTFSMATREPHYRNGLPYDQLTGLEAGLIEILDPELNPFNSKGRKRRSLQTAPVIED